MILALAAGVCAFLSVTLLTIEFAGGGATVGGSLARAARYGRRPTAAEPVAVSEEPQARTFSVVDTLARVVPGDRLAIAAKLSAAGLGRFRPELFKVVKLVAAGAGLLFGGLLLAAGGGSGAAILALVGLCIGFVLPDFVVGARERTRREQALTEFPNALDLLAVTVEAGLGLDASIARYVETAEGPLAQELALLVTELRVGGSRVEAFRRFAERLPSAETKSFVRAIVHADQLGVSLASTLRAQAHESRFRRQAIVEETANKAPVKMLFPTVLCIFPALFVVLLGPPILNLSHSL